MALTTKRCEIFFALIALGATCFAAFKEYEWEKFGYSSSILRSLIAGDDATWTSPMFNHPQQACEGIANAVNNLYPGNPALALRACATGSAEIFSCAQANQPCRAANYFDTSIDVTPACRRQPQPLIQPRAGAVGYAEFNYRTGKCNCTGSQGNGSSFPVKSLWPDSDTIYCYEPPELFLYPYQAKYDRKAPDAILRLSTFIVRKVDTILKKPDLKISIKTTSGEPGKLSNQILDANGIIRFDYTFPSFSEAKTDTIVVTCDICLDGVDVAALDIPMVPTLVGFFNGVWNTREQAGDGLKELRLQTEAVKGKQNLKFDLFYNQTGSRTGSTSGLSALQDLAEVFDQRSRELDGVLSNRWETFWDITSAQHASVNSGIGGLLRLLGSKATAIASLVDSIFNATLSRIVTDFARRLGDPPTAADLAAHNAKLQKFAENGYPVVLIAHSQGNLFVNSAFDTLRTSKPDAPAKVVHIAPASPTLRGDYALASIDLVINGLRLQGTTSVPLINLTMVGSTSDISGHTLVGTYLDATRIALERIKSMIKAAIEGV